MRTGRLKGLLATAKDEGWSEWIRSEADERAVLSGCWFDREAAARVEIFFERFLRHSKGEWAGKPFRLQEWQKRDLLFPLFAWKKRNGYRRFRNAYIEVPKKNGKSALCSGISLYLLVADGEPGAEVYSAAADRDQASIVYGEAERMVMSSPALSRRLRVIPSRKTILFPRTNSVYRALSADVPTKEGLNIHGLIFDELHAQKSRELFDTLRYGGAARRQPLLVSITTAGFDRNSICWEQHEYARKVLKGIVEDESFFAYIRAANEDPNEGPVDDWTSREAWYKANPSLGVTISEEAFAAECREAQEKPTLQNAFKRYRLNIWTSADVRWMPMDRWEFSAGNVDPLALVGKSCFGGLDLSTTLDITACVFVFPWEDGVYKVHPLFWIPEENMRERSSRDRVPYEVWARQGLVRTTPGNVVDYSWIEKDILEFAKRHKVEEIAYDQWNATEIIQRLTDAGLVMVPVRQGFASMSGPMKQTEALVYAGKLHHGGNPVLRWMADNVQASIDPAGNMKPDKGRSRERIDGIVALIMAIGRAAMRENQASVYEERGLISL
jgi:phage terminase large subunit-like protein